VTHRSPSLKYELNVKFQRLNPQPLTELPEGDAADHLEPGQLDRAHRFRSPQEARYTQPSTPNSKLHVPQTLIRRPSTLNTLAYEYGSAFKNLMVQRSKTNPLAWSTNYVFNL